MDNFTFYSPTYFVLVGVPKMRQHYVTRFGNQVLFITAVAL